VSTHCLRAQKQLVVAVREGDFGAVGRVVAPGVPGCWHCAWARLKAAPFPSGEPWPVMGDAILGQLAAFEIFRATTGVQPNVGPGSLLHVETRQLRVVTRPLPAWPGCKECGEPDALLAPLLAAWRARVPVASTEASRAVERVVDSHTGLLAKVDPEALTQAPLYQCQATLRLPGLPTVVAAGRHLDEARQRALRQGLTAYAQRLAEWQEDSRGAVDSEGRPQADVDARSKPFVGGATADEWVGHGLLAMAERLGEQRLSSGESVPMTLLALDLEKAGEWPLFLFKTAVSRLGGPLEIYRFDGDGPLVVLAFRHGAQWLRVAAERSLSAAWDRGLESIVHALQKGPGESVANEASLAPPPGGEGSGRHGPSDKPEETSAWSHWTPNALKWLEGHGRKVWLRPFTTDPAVARAGWLCGWVWHEDASA